MEGRLGKAPKKTGFALVKRGLAHMLASDAHSPDLRSIGLSGAVRAVGGGALADWLTQEVAGGDRLGRAAARAARHCVTVLPVASRKGV